MGEASNMNWMKSNALRILVEEYAGDPLKDLDADEG
jgi:hypothetical protein